MKLSDFVIQYLENYGIKNIFLVPGGGCIHLVDSLGKSEKIEYVCNLHEQASGICADAYAQYKNDIGVALVTTGPGGTNIITAIAGAWLDSIPLIVICGQVNRADMVGDRGVRQFGFQEINMSELCETITKYSKCITNPQDIEYELDLAIETAKSGRPGPVVIEIPLDVQSSNIDINTLRKYKSSYIKVSPYEEEIDRIIKDLNKAKKPIILAGNGIRLANALPEFYEFIMKTKIPVLSTWKAIDFLHEDHPLNVGRPGVFGQRGANKNQQEADFILCIGARLDYGQIAYSQENFAKNATKVFVDVDFSELEKFDAYVDYKVMSDAKEFLSLINSKIKSIKCGWSSWLEECKDLYLKYPVVLPEYKNEELPYVNVYVFMDKLSDLLPENSLIIPGSSGTCSEVTMQSIKLKKGSRVFNTEGLGPMGFGIPAAIGGCIASGKKDTICIDGDGGMFMNIQELELIKRLELPIKLFIFNNNGYGAIKNSQKNHFNGRLVASDPTSGLTLPSIKNVVESYGLRFFRISKNNEMDMVDTILNINGPVVCEIMMDENHETLPRTIVYTEDDGTFKTFPMNVMKPLLEE